MAVTAAYVAVVLLVATFMDHTASFDRAADSTSWYLPAVSLLHNGTLSVAEYPALDFYRSPGVPVFFAGLMYFAGGESIPAIVTGQIFALYATALLFRATVKDWYPQYADLGMALILFNPSLLAMAFFVESETLATLSAMVVLFFLLRYVRGRTAWPTVLALGFSLGVACLVRTNPVYLVYLLPVVLPLISAIEGHGIAWPRAALKGAAAMLLAVAVLAPLTLAIYQRTGHIGASSLISPRAEFEYLQDQLVILEATHGGTGTREAKLRLDDQREAFAKAQGPKWDALGENEQFVILKGWVTRELLSYPPGEFLKTLGMSMVQFLFGAGAGYWHSLMGTFAGGMVQAFSETSRSEIGSFFRKIWATIPLGALLLSAAAFGFVAATRLALVGGVIDMMQRRRWALLLVLASVIAYYGLSTLFQGQARYRAPVEPALMLMAVAGVAWWRERRTKARGVPAAA